MNHASTLGELFANAVAQHPDEVALVDPANREIFTSGSPRSLTYAQADRVVTAIAAKLNGLGLHVGSVVAQHLPCTVESVLMLLGTLRAGMTPAPLPMLWREADAGAALIAAGAKAIVTTRRIGSVDHCAIAMHAAALAFQVRHVCAFGANIPDDIVPLDGVFASGESAPTHEQRPGRPALITFEIEADGIAARGHSHADVLAGAAFLANRKPDKLLTTVPLSSFAGIVLGIVPWLRSGGTLVLHQPFDPNVFAAARGAHRCDTIVLPGPMLSCISDADLLAGNELESIIGLWRSREQLAAAQPWRGDADLFDALAVGETELAAGPRSKQEAEDRYNVAWRGRR